MPPGIYDFHDVALRIQAPQEILEALSSRLGRFPRSSRLAPDLTFEFQTIQRGSQGSIEKPSGRSRRIYELRDGEALYFPGGDQLYLALEKVQVLSDFGTHKTSIELYARAPGQIHLATHFLFTVPLIEQLKRFARFNVHSAGLGRNGRSILFTGPSGSGKSTISIALLRAGFDFLADDMIFVARSPHGLRALAFPEDLKLASHTIGLFDELASLRNVPLEPRASKCSVPFDRPFPANTAWESRPVAIVFVRVGDHGESTLQPMSAAEAFTELAPNVLLTQPAACQMHFDVLSELSETCQCYRMQTGRDFHRLPLLAAKLLA
jgi:predicted ATPase